MTANATTTTRKGKTMQTLTNPNNTLRSSTVHASASLAMILALFVGLWGRADTLDVTTQYDSLRRVRVSDGLVQYVFNTAGVKPVGPDLETTTYSKQDWNLIFAFDLSTVTKDVASAELAVFLDAINIQPANSIEYNADVWGVGYSASSAALLDTAANLWLYEDTDANPTHFKVADNLITPANASVNTWYTVYDSDGVDKTLAEFLNDRPAGQDVVWFRINHDVPDISVPTADDVQRLSMGYQAGETPVLTFTAIPEPATLGLFLLGLVAAISRKRR